MSSLLDAAYNVVADYPGGAASLAPRIGKGVSTLSHETTATGTAKLGLLDAEKITELSNDERILELWVTKRGKMMVPLPEAIGTVDDDCLLRLGHSAKEFSEMCSAVSESMSDGKVSDNELERIYRECGELIASLQALRIAAARRNLEGKPA